MHEGIAKSLMGNLDFISFMEEMESDAMELLINMPLEHVQQRAFATLYIRAIRTVMSDIQTVANGGELGNFEERVNGQMTHDTPTTKQ